MADSTQMLEQPKLGATARRDAWWVAPLLTFLALTTFGIYSAWAVWVGDHYEYGPYLSPFYSPNLKEFFGLTLPFSFPFLFLWIPLGFRATCYYYRKAYYRSFFLDPPACAVGEPSGRHYKGEMSFPFVLQNVHRYFFYLATIVLAFLWYDAIKAFFFADGLHVNVGTLVLLFNVLTLSAFSFGCNSLRHLVGGRLDCFTCSASARMRVNLWGGVSILNLRDMEWDWISLFAVGFADLYVRLCSMGIWHDVRLF